MHFVEISLLKELIVCSSCFFSYNNCLIEIFLQSLDIIFQFFALYILLRNIFALNFLSLLEKFIPFLLEVIERIGHFVSDKEIPQEHVDLNSLLCGLMGLLHVYNWDSSRKYVFVA